MLRRYQADWDEFDDPTTVMTSMQVALRLGRMGGAEAAETQWTPQQARKHHSGVRKDSKTQWCPGFPQLLYFVARFACSF